MIPITCAVAILMSVIPAIIGASPSYYHLKDVESYLILDSLVYRYDGYIYLPYVLSCPIKDMDKLIPKSEYGHLFTGKDTEKILCPTKETVEQVISSTKAYIKNIIPKTEVITTEYSGFTETMLREGVVNSVLESEVRLKLLNRHAIEEDINSTMANVIRDARNLGVDHPLVSSKKGDLTASRTKRAATLLVTAGITILSLIIGGFSWNRADIKNLNNEMLTLDINMDRIKDKINEQTLAIDKLVVNQHNILR